jgi:hypothetical protein
MKPLISLLVPHQTRFLKEDDPKFLDSLKSQPHHLLRIPLFLDLPQRIAAFRL